MVRRYLGMMSVVLLCSIGVGSFVIDFFSHLDHVSSIFGDLLQVDEVFAQVDDSRSLTDQTSDSQIEVMNGLQRIIRVIYLLMRPLLTVAGAALDNSLVYGDWFYLRTSLWSMRQIMRNFANFALGGIFLFAIFYNIAKGGAAEKRSFKKVLPRLLFATLGIQASRFLMSAMIDLSQLGVYTVGTLPMTVLSQTDKDTGENTYVQELGEIRFIKPHIKFSLDDTRAQNGTDSTHSVMYSCNDMPTQNILNEDGEEIEAVEQTTHFIPCRIDGGYFVKRGKKGDGNSRENRKANQAQEWQNHSNTTEIPIISNNYCIFNKRVVENLSMTQDTQEPMIMDKCMMAALESGESNNTGNISVKGLNYMNNFDCTKLDQFITKATGMTGPMYSLYASIFQFGELALTPNNKSVVEISLEFLLKLIVAFMLIIPLFVLAIVLVVRAVVLRGFIIFLPILVLSWVFDFSLSESVGEKLKLNTLLSLIFMPVVAVFAISMSLIVLTLLSNVDKGNGGIDQDAMSALGIQRTDIGTDCNPDGTRVDDVCNNNPGQCGDLDSYCYDILGITSLCFTQSQRVFGNSVINTFTRLAINIFGIGLMWMVVFAALKTNAITGGIAKVAQKFTGDMLKNAPIVPSPMGMTSIGALKQAATQTGNIPRTMAAAQSKNMNKYLDNIGAKRSTSAKALKSGIVQSNDDFTKAVTANDTSAIAQARTTAMNTISNLPKNTNLSNYTNTDIHKTMGIAAGLNATELESINNIEDAFANKKIYNKVIKGERKGDFVGYEAGRQENMDIAKQGFERLANDTTQPQFVGHSDNATNANKLYYDKDAKEFVEIGLDNKIKMIPVNSLMDTTKINEFVSSTDLTLIQHNNGRLNKILSLKTTANTGAAEGTETVYHITKNGDIATDAQKNQASTAVLKLQKNGDTNTITSLGLVGGAPA